VEPEQAYHANPRQWNFSGDQGRIELESSASFAALSATEKIASAQRMAGSINLRCGCNDHDERQERAVHLLKTVPARQSDHYTVSAPSHSPFPTNSLATDTQANATSISTSLISFS
jgi:hypothetical protein